MSQALHELSAAEAARRIARKELSSEALVHACLDRIGAREPDAQAWAFLDREMALAQARARDREQPRSPLHGIPVGIKDVLDTADMPSEYGSPIHRGHRPRADAACVALLRAAGCVILGKSVTTEFANIHPAQTRNPRNPAHTPGGSSSGSAAAVADCMVPLAVGTQTGGSIIRPSAYCGVVGLKPTFNSINRAGLKFSAETLDTIGLIARSVEDVALGLHVLSERGAPVSGGNTRTPRIGLVRTPHWHDADAASRENLERTAALLAQAGAAVSDTALPPKSDGLYEGHSKIALYEAARALAHESRDAFAVMMRGFDFLLTLSAPNEAPRGLQSTGSSIFNRIWTLLGAPCVNLPAGRGPSALPLGVQLAGRVDGDDDLLAWAHWATLQQGKMSP